MFLRLSRIFLARILLVVAEAWRFASAGLGMAVCDVSGSVAPKPAKFLTRPARPDNDTNLPLAGAVRSADRLSSALASNSPPGSCLCTTGGPACDLRYLPFFRRHPVAFSRGRRLARKSMSRNPHPGMHDDETFSVPPIAKSVDRVHRDVFEGGVLGLVIWLKAFWLKGNLCQNIESGQMFFLRGLLACPLQLMHKTRAQDLFRCQKEVEAMVPGLGAVTASFDSTIQLATTDRYAANICAEQAMASLNPKQANFHLFCDVHRLSTCQTWQLGVVASHISALISLGLLCREAGFAIELRSCISKVFQARLQIQYAEPPAGQIQEHRHAVAKLFLGNQVSRIEDKVGSKRAKQLAALMFFLDGDWESETIQCYTKRPISRESLLRILARYVVPALLPGPVSVFPRSRWHGGEIAVDEAGILFACHNIGSEALRLYLAQKPAMPRGLPAAATSELDNWSALQDLSGEFVDPGLVQAVDACADETQVPAEATQGQESETQAGKTVDWAAVNRSMKNMVNHWAASNPGPCLVLVRWAMSVPVRLMRRFLHVAGSTWEKQQQLKASRGHSRCFRIAQAHEGEDVATAFSGLSEAFHDAIQALPLSARNNSFKVLAFRLLARLGGAMHQLLRLPRAGFPYRMFSLMLSTDKAEAAEALLRCPPCLLDPGSRGFLSNHRAVDQLCNPTSLAELEALAIMAEIDVVSIETRHAAARRLFTWGFNFGDIAAEHLCRQCRRARDDLGQPAKKFRRHSFRKRKHVPRPSGKKRGRKAKAPGHKESRGGGAQRAFYHAQLPLATRAAWRDRRALFADLARRFKSLTPQELKHYEELGKAATISKKHGGPGFLKAAAGRSSRGSNRQEAVVPVSEADRLAHEATEQVNKACLRAANAQRLQLSVERAQAVELREYQEKHPFVSYGYGVTDTLAAAAPAGERHGLTPEPGHLCAAKWAPPLVSASKDSWLK